MLSLYVNVFTGTVIPEFVSMGWLVICDTRKCITTATRCQLVLKRGVSIYFPGIVSYDDIGLRLQYGFVYPTMQTCLRVQQQVRRSSVY